MSGVRVPPGAPTSPVKYWLLHVISACQSRRAHSLSHVHDQLHWSKLSFAGTHPARRGFAVRKHSVGPWWVRISRFFETASGGSVIPGMGFVGCRCGCSDPHERLGRESTAQRGPCKLRRRQTLPPRGYPTEEVRLVCASRGVAPPKNRGSPGSTRRNTLLASRTANPECTCPGWNGDTGLESHRQRLHRPRP